MLDSDDCLVKEDSNSDLKSEEGIGSGPFMHNICVWCVQYISVLFGHEFEELEEARQAAGHPRGDG